MKLHLRRRYLVLVLLLVASIGIGLFYLREYAVLPLPAYYLLNEIESPTSTDKVLVISPHPDDETLGAGGFISRSLEKGATVKVVIATDGNKHGLKKIRHEETIKALGILGVKSDDISFLDYPDGGLSKVSGQVTTSLTNVETNFKPTIILSTDPADIHPDHRVVGKAVDAIVAGMPQKPIVYQFLVHYHRYPRPEGFRPSTFLLPPVKLLSTTHPWLKLTLSEEEQNAKNEAVLQYKSQLSHRNPILRGLLLSFIRENELFTKAP